jgi:hypothetical protein
MPELSITIQGLRTRLYEAKRHYSVILGLELSLLNSRDSLLVRAWHVGQILAGIKEEIGHGKWLIWIEANWPELGERNSQRCIALFKENPNPRNSTDLRDYCHEAAKDFTPESVRKFMWGYIPAKERPEIPGDAPVTQTPHYLTVINHFSKFDRQLEIGHIKAAPVETMRRDFEPMIRKLVVILGKEYFEDLLHQ